MQYTLASDGFEIRRGVLSESQIKMFVAECCAGDVLLMSPLLLHSSKRSEVPVSRKIIHFEYAREKDLDAKLNWFESR